MSEQTQPKPSLKLGEFARRAAIAAALFALAVLLVLFIFYAIYIVEVLFAGILLGVGLDGLARIVRRFIPVGQALAVTIAILVILGIIVGTCWLIEPRVEAQVVRMIHDLPTAMDRLAEQMNSSALGRWLMSKVDDARAWIGTYMNSGKVAGAVFSSVDVVAGFIVVIFIAIYLAGRPALYIDGLAMLFAIRGRGRVHEVMRAIGHTLRWWLIGRLAAMAAVGILDIVAFWLLGVPLAVTLGIIGGLLTFVPNFGAILATIPAGLIALLISPKLMLWVIVVKTIVQMLEGYVITPLIQRRAVAIAPAMIIASQFVFGILTGALGLILATPMVTALIVLVRTLYVNQVLGDRVPAEPKVEG